MHHVQNRVGAFPVPSLVLSESVADSTLAQGLPDTSYEQWTATDSWIESISDLPILVKPSYQMLGPAFASTAPGALGQVKT